MVTNMTSSQGRKRRISIFIVTGNKNGVAGTCIIPLLMFFRHCTADGCYSNTHTGFGLGKATSQHAAMRMVAKRINKKRAPIKIMIIIILIVIPMTNCITGTEPGIPEAGVHTTLRGPHRVPQHVEPVPTLQDLHPQETEGCPSTTPVIQLTTPNAHTIHTST